MEKKEKILLSIYFIIITIFLLSTINIEHHVIKYDSNPFGFLHLVTFSFILCLIGLLVIVYFSYIYKYYYLSILFILTFGGIIWITPLITNTLPKIWDSYSVLYLSQTIVSNHGFSFNWVNEPFLDYIQFPLSFILHSECIILFNYSPVDYINIYTFSFVPIIILSYIFLFMKVFNSKSFIIICSLFFTLLAVNLQVHPCPQSYSSVLLPILLGLTISKKKSIYYLIPTMIIVLALIMAHPVSSLILIIFIFTYGLIIKFSPIDPDNGSIPMNFFIYTTIIFLSWMVFIAIKIFNSSIRTFYSNINNLFMQDTINATVSGGISILPQQIRLTFIIASIILITFYIIVAAVYKLANRYVITSLFITSIIFLLLNFNTLGGNLQDRTLIIIEICMSISLGSLILLINKKIIYAKIINYSLLLIILIMLINTTTLYYQDPIQSYTYSELNGYKFVDEMKDNNSYMLNYHVHPSKILLITNTNNTLNTILNQKYYSNENPPTIVGYSYKFEAIMMFNGLRDQNELIKTDLLHNRSKIYSNMNYCIYTIN